MNLFSHSVLQSLAGLEHGHLGSRDLDNFLGTGVTAGAGSAAVGWHELGANLILILVLMHLGVILFYRHWKHEDLITPMLTGIKEIPEDAAAAFGAQSRTPDGERPGP